VEADTLKWIAGIALVGGTIWFIVGLAEPACRFAF
jgi:hypothetical protein